ncbi:excinuclease ABC subunit UvrC [Neobacillus drentensis]|uniref:excinuclease ABC subunit UvrC n=1 Tax=Neobacillus drentensis TaxID=220684 RepID=UPI000BF99F14|nr:excinuclease ABC subunit C [Bacillus sp. AFS006103]
MNQTIKSKLKILPEKPGCYLMKNSCGRIIYVGKAKVLKNRVYSYFVGSHDEKTQSLIKEIEDFDYIVTSSNTEALILEMNLIKENLPKYNILLKDDKSYPYIKITNERHSRLIITREVKNDNGKYFGPYPNVQAANETKKLLEYLYPLRRCSLSCKRACLYYHLGRCIGPCAREVSTAEYKESIDGILRFFNNGYKDIKKQLKRERQSAAARLNFEKARELQNKIDQIKVVMEKNIMLTKDFIDRDVVGMDVREGWMCVQVFFVRKGKVTGRDVSIFEFSGKSEKALCTYLKQFYLHDGIAIPKEVILPIPVNKELAKYFPKIKVIVPKRGQKKELLKFATENAHTALTERFCLHNQVEKYKNES